MIVPDGTSDGTFDEASNENLRKFLGLPSEAEKAAASAAFQEKLRDIFIAGLPDTSAQDLLRAIVERDEWFVPVQPDGTLQILEAKAGKFRAAIDLEGEQNARNKAGRGGRLLPIYDAPPGAPSTLLDGRALARALSDEFDALLLHQAELSPRELGSEYFADMKSVAQACDFEDLLARPAPDQTEKLLNVTWLVPMAKRELLLNNAMGDGNLAHVFTHSDRVNFHERNHVVAMSGERLCRLVVENEKLDGVVVNSLRDVGRGEYSIRAPAYAPAFFHRLLEGEDIRVGISPLIARSRKEVELWLYLRNFPLCYGEIFEEVVDGTTHIQARTTHYVSMWRMQESFANQEELVPPVCSPDFIIRDYPDDEPSRILCPGLLAAELNAGAMKGKDAARYWRVGRNLLIGRYLDEAWKKLSRNRLELARELAKFLPSGENQIPRSALKTVAGAAFLSTHPHGGSRDWIEETIRQAERYTKTWVWRG